MSRRDWWAWLGGSILGAALLCGQTPTPLRIAAASNFTATAAPLRAAWEQSHPTIPLEFSFAATGSLVAQIRHGAPYDVLLAADLAYPHTLVRAELTRENAPVVFAHGRLLLWPAPKGDPATALRQSSVRHIAIAQPDTAPYGAAAREWLAARDLWEPLQPKLVRGENIAQTHQFVASGHADFGFIAASLLVGFPEYDPGLSLELPPDALPHAAVTLRRSAQPEHAAAFLRWLTSPAARPIWRDHGYRVP